MERDWRRYGHHLSPYRLRYTCTHCSKAFSSDWNILSRKDKEAHENLGVNKHHMSGELETYKIHEVLKVRDAMNNCREGDCDQSSYQEATLQPVQSPTCHAESSWVAAFMSCHSCWGGVLVLQLGVSHLVPVSHSYL